MDSSAAIITSCRLDAGKTRSGREAHTILPRGSPATPLRAPVWWQRMVSQRVEWFHCTGPTRCRSTILSQCYRASPPPRSSEKDKSSSNTSASTASASSATASSASPQPQPRSSHPKVASASDTTRGVICAACPTGLADALAGYVQGGPGMGH
jgi:hypothetical protein